MGRAVRHLYRDQRGAVAVTVGLSLFALIAAGGIAFDYARLASMDTELQQAADQAALAAASQLDGKANAITRATAAAQNLVVNQTRFANDGGGANVGNFTLTFYTSYDQAADNYGAVTTADANAKVVRINVGGRTANYALTPIVGALSAGPVQAEAVASIGNAICKNPPVMVCNPDELASNNNEDLPFTAVRGNGLRLITGSATVPGNFGWLEAAIANGSNALAASLGYNSPPGDCQPTTGVTTKTGMDTSVLKAFNTRFDVYANGNTTCPSQFGGVCSPSPNTRKDVMCKPNGAKTACLNDTWNEAGTPYRLPTQTTTTCVPKKNGGQTCTTTTSPVEQPIPTSGPDPTIMGYPRDICQAGAIGSTSCGTKGNGVWDRDAYFRVNYKWTNSQWKAGTGLTDTGVSAASRFDVYQWELAHPSVTGGTGTAVGMNVPQVNGNEAAFSFPATGRSSAPASTTQADRRRISVAVLNCQALNVHGKTSDAPVPTWLDVFLVEPAVDRTGYSDGKEVYVEIIGVTTAASANAGQVVRRDKPFLIR